MHESQNVLNYYKTSLSDQIICICMFLFRSTIIHPIMYPIGIWLLAVKRAKYNFGFVSTEELGCELGPVDATYQVIKPPVTKY